MSYFLIDNPTTRADHQHRSPRRQRQSGTIGIHNSGTSVITPLQLARSIANNSLPASYHEIVRGSEWLSLLPDDVEAFQIATAGMNQYAWGLCFTGSDGSFDVNDPETLLSLRTGAVRIRAYCDRQGFDVEQVARWLTADQAYNREPGLVHHGIVQPADRSDAWKYHPQRVELERYLVEQILAGTPARPQEWDEMATKEDLRAVVAEEIRDVAAVHDLGSGKTGDKVWALIRGSKTRRHVPDPVTYTWLRNVGLITDIQVKNGVELFWYREETDGAPMTLPEGVDLAQALRDIGFGSVEDVKNAVAAEIAERMAA